MKALAAVGGVGGLIAALMFYFYRKDTDAHSKRQEEYIARTEKMNSALISVVRDNTAAMTSIVASAHALQSVVSTLDVNANNRDLWFREHIAPLFAQLGRREAVVTTTRTEVVP